MSFVYPSNFEASLQASEHRTYGSAVFKVFSYFCRIAKGGFYTVSFKTCNCVVFTNFQHRKLSF